MIEVQTGSEKFEKNGDGHAIVWLPLGVEITLDVLGGELEMSTSPSVPDQRAVVSDSPDKVAVSKVYRAFRGMTFTLKASAPANEYVRFLDRSGREVGRLVAVAREVKKHPGMEFDLLADIIGGSDPRKTLAVQRLLFNLSENIFDQNNDANEKEYGHLACGKVVNGSGKALFGSMSPIFYENPFHEPLNQVKDRSDVKYKAVKIFPVRTAIREYLAKGTPVRVGVLDSPVGMFVQNRKLVAYYSGGHTTLIVGCDSSASKFLYIDTWPGGSHMKYEGGLSGAVADRCEYMGMYTAKFDPTRAVGSATGSGGPNLLRQDPATEGTFNTAGDNYLEIVAGPIQFPS